MDREVGAGIHNVVWDAGDMASGVYFYRLQAGDRFIKSQKMMLIK
jgi:hypothetical protein